MAATYIKKDHVQYDLFDSGMYSREIINVLFISEVSWLIKHLNIGIYSDIING